MSILKIAVVVIIGVIALALVKNSNLTISSFLRLALVIMVFAFILPELKSLLSVLSLIEFPEGISIESLKIMFKIFGVLALGSLCSDICRDNGENGLGSAVELCTRIVAIGLGLPVITAVITTATVFMS